MRRYSDRVIAINDNNLYKDFFNKKKINSVTQYTTPVLKFPTIEQMSTLNLVQHIWSKGDRFYKLAANSYGDPSMWWVIAWFNHKPTEAHISLGDTVQIPYPLDKVLRYFGV